MGISLSKDNQPEDQPQKPSIPRSGSLLRKGYKDINEDYKFLKQLGSGKFAVTYLYKERKTGKKYACKTIPKRRLFTNSEKEDLKREVAILECLKGAPNVVELKDTYEDPKYVHLVMEYCEGGELYDKMDSKGLFNEKVAAQILGSIMKFVSLLHRMGIMHRDLKPENFLLPKKSALGFVPCAQKGSLGPCLADDYSMMKAIDFGLSTYTDEVTQDKVGTAFYVAPEVLRRQPYGEKVDIWSAGVILYMLLTGAPPFYAETDEQIFERITQNKPPDMESYPWTKRSDEAKNLVKNMLSYDPKKRPTAEKVLGDPWLKINGVEYTIDDKFSNKVKHFRAMNIFKKLAYKTMTKIIPQEELQELKLMFYDIDTDERKLIKPDEFKNLLAKLDSKLTSEEIDEIVNAADVDENGSIDYDEFITAIMNFQRKHKAEELRKVFKHFDKNDDNYISKDELKSVLEEHKFGNEATIDEIIEQVDVNQDGHISYIEFVDMIKN
uniref:calcium-dependent protein kinase 33 n=1 Tax=Erigeron canadensis TaxID=72917 RepID=UPI001CB9D500|nr:calcium-dependent protein kinase 33 [Erigeron canadensis]